MESTGSITRALQFHDWSTLAKHQPLCSQASPPRFFKPSPTSAFFPLLIIFIRLGYDRPPRHE